VIGVFSVATNLAQVVSSTCSRLISSVLFPLFSMWNREQPGALSRRLRLVRGKILAVFLLPPCLLAIFGDFIIQSLYDNRYHDAGWMLTWLSIGLIPQLMVMTTEPILLASGDSFRHMTLTVLKGIVTVGAVAIGGFLDGVRGILIGSVVGSALQYPLLIPVARSTKVWMPMQDLLAVVLSGMLIYFGKMLWGR
jgi:O-antigen/teichoic acid export membrane protein